MKTLSIDIETFCETDLKTAGAYKYAEKSEILMIGYASDLDPVQLDVVTNKILSNDLREALLDPRVLKKAWNASFERANLSKYFGLHLPPEQWECTMMRSVMLGLPASLDEAARVTMVENQKDSIGKALIRYFCVPCKPTKANGQRTRNLPEHDPEKWEAFKKYCMLDVAAERDISKKLDFFNIPRDEMKLWCLDQRINERGIMVDLDFANTAIDLDLTFRERLLREAEQITGLENTNSVAQLKKWLSTEMEEEVTSLSKDKLPQMLKDTDSESAKRIIEIRQDLSKTSVKKFTAMLKAACSDDRVRGLLQFYGASRTGRWAGRLVQVQNLPRGKFKDFETPRKLVMENDAEMLELCYGAIPDTLSSLIRSAFIPKKGRRFIISDFSAIEARVIAWLAREPWRIEVFNTHGKIYEASASKMFKIPLDQVSESDRQKGKVAELALGYQGGVGALIKMGALDMGVMETELHSIVFAWRDANKKIALLWRNVEKAAKLALTSGERVEVDRGLAFSTKKRFLIMHLPSGRDLYYPKCSLEQTDRGSKIVYWGVDQTIKKWCKIDTYGGKLVENAVQAIARDCLAYGMLNLNDFGYNIAIHVHDEVVCEEEEGVGSLEEVNALLSENAPWAEGLPLKAVGCESYYYKK
jgi:DNA polymerase